MNYMRRISGERVSGLGSPTVVIVEDEWLVRMELATAFEDEGYVVLESASADDALTTLRAAGRIDLLVTDIRLGGPLTGWDIAIEARLRDPAVAVIYVSANPPAPDRSVPGSVFIGKPAYLTDIVAAARRLVG
jgi:CheY-like chemotaxis protein